MGGKKDTTVLRIGEKQGWVYNAGNTLSRNPWIVQLKKSTTLRFYYPTTSNGFRNINSKKTFEVGKTYNVAYIMDSNRFTFEVDGVIEDSL